jgi:hypothetical protein
VLIHKEGLFARLRVAALLALLLAAPAIHAASSDPDPSWFEIIENWLVCLLQDEPPPPDGDNGVLQIPGG